jgi:outer membrane protein assembly factor BamD (BamD/ComL family)
MSIIGILASNFFSASPTPNTANAGQSSANGPSRFQQIQAEFQQLGQDLQSGNLTQAQSDFSTLAQNFPGATQNAVTGASSTAGNGTVAQAFAQLGQDLQSGNLREAQQDYTNLQQDVQQSIGQQVEGHRHHHHRVEGSQNSSQQTNPIAQVFRTLAQDLQAGNLSGAQSAFATLQSDLQQIGGFIPAGSSGSLSTIAPVGLSSLNVSA